MDYTKMLEKIIPTVDGEDKLRLRTGTVTTVNADGTLDITMSDGVLLPNVNKLATAYAPAGAVVQIIVFRGAMLVIGAVGSGGGNGPIVKTGTTTGGPSGVTFWSSGVLNFGVTFPAAPNVHVNLPSTATGTPSWVGRAWSITSSTFRITAYGPSASFNETWQWTAIYAP